MFAFFVLFYFSNYCISVFMLLCFVFRCSIGNIVSIISCHGVSVRWSTPFWQSAYRLRLMCTFIFNFISTKLCCCCCPWHKFYG